MRELYERLIEEGEVGILRLIEERVQEGVQLDFKQKGDPRRGAFDNNDKKILAKAVSGFANSAGGLLVWGVNAEKGPDGVDCAQSPAAPIAQIELFQSEATTLVGQLIQPRHDGIHLHTIPSVVSPGAGYLLIYIARSERRPHRSEASGQKQYFKRAGDSFFEMEHYDIEDAFARSSSADLEVSVIQNGFSKMGLVYEFQIHVELHNEAYTAAKYPYVVISNLRNISYDHSWNQFTKVTVKYETGVVSALGGVDQIVHAVQRLRMITLQLSAEINVDVWSVGGVNADEVEVSFDYVIGCENGRRKEGRFACLARDLIKP